MQVALAFTSLQTADKGPNGDVCDNWTLAYTMIQSADGTWLIDRTQPYNGVSHTSLLTRQWLRLTYAATGKARRGRPAPLVRHTREHDRTALRRPDLPARG